eukprot:1742345-Rhodomonas_salina.1
MPEPGEHDDASETAGIGGGFAGTTKQGTHSTSSSAEPEHSVCSGSADESTHCALDEGVGVKAAHFDANAFISNMAAIALREKVGKQLKDARTELAALMVETTILSPTTRRRRPTPRMQDYQPTLEARRTRRTRFLVAHVANLERQLQAVEAILY